MITELSLMAGSLMIMVGLYLHRYAVTTHGMSTRADKVKEKMDPIIEDAHAKTNSVIASFNWRAISLFVHDVFVYVAKLFMHASRKTHNVSSALAEKASQRKENLSKGGAASFYIKQIKDAKKNATDSVE